MKDLVLENIHLTMTIKQHEFVELNKTLTATQSVLKECKLSAVNGKENGENVDSRNVF